VNRASLKMLVTAEIAKAVNLGGATLPYNIERGLALTNGVAAGASDVVYVATRTLVASGSEDLDLAGTLADPFGVTGTAVFARIRGILISAAKANVNNVLVGGVAAGVSSFLSPAATGIITLRPDAAFMLTCGAADATGYAVTATTADLLHVANSAGGSSVSYDIAIFGTSS
jgi:hypothetical protein